MKILFFIDSLRSGGKERRVTELIKALQRLPGFEIEILLMSEEIHYKDILSLGLNISYLVRTGKKDLKVFGRLYKIFKKLKPDLVHTWDSMTAIYAAPVCKILNIKFVNSMVIDSPGYGKYFSKHWIRAKMVFPMSDIIIGNSKAGLAAYNAPRKKSYVIYNGFNFTRLENLKPSEEIRKEIGADDKKLIGMVATFAENKDYKTFFRAGHLVLNNRSDVCFLAVGRGTDSEKAKSFLDKKYIVYYRLLGERTDVESLINAMDICVLSTFTEGISNSILEYMALGKPVIATSGGGTNEIVEDRKTGFLISQSSPEELAEKILWLLDDYELRFTMGKEGKARIEKYFSINSMILEYTTIYQRLASKY